MFSHPGVTAVYSVSDHTHITIIHIHRQFLRPEIFSKYVKVCGLTVHTYCEFNHYYYYKQMILDAFICLMI